MEFKDLGLSPEVLRALDEKGYKNPTPIQEAAIPLILMTRDVVGLAQTGTGKTASFTLPMIEILYGGRAKARMPRSLILSPTRELAAQIAENFDTYGKYHKLTKALLVGGESMGDQMKLLDRGVDVLIATPGRLLDLFDRGSLLLNDIKILVIDEADRMLDMGFIPDIEKIVSKVPPMRQTLLFSATMPPEIKKLTDKFLSNPKQVAIAATSAPAATVTQTLVWTTRKNKMDVLAELIKKEDVKNAFVFCNRKRDIGDLAKFLGRKGYNAAPMHGDMPQSSRTQTLKDFKDNKIVLLICSDVAARGIDIAEVSHVFNYDVPMNAEDYVHRIGRTGRAGKNGRAYSLATDDDQKYVAAIERLMNTKIDVEVAGGAKPPSEAVAAPREERAERPREENRNRDRGDRPDRGPRPDRDARPPRPEGESRPPRNDRPPVKRNQDDDMGTNRFADDDLPSFLRKK